MKPIENKENNYLLTIAIPTYNRSKYLDLCLAQICKQLPGNEQFVELIVSDNNSADSSEEVVKKYIAQGCDIRYIKNKENIGAAGNVFQCYQQAKGKYLLILGDDDIFSDGSINSIINILKEKDYCIAYLKQCAHKNNSTHTSRNYTPFNNIREFIKKTHYGLTFISGNIVNKS